MANILITACNSFGKGNNYFYGLINLIVSCKKFAKNNIDKIVVFDCGLEDIDRQLIATVPGLEILSFGETYNQFINSMNPEKFKIYIDKVYSLYNSNMYAKTGDNCLFLDAGVCLIDSIHEIYDIIDKEGIFVVECEDQITKTWITDEIISYLNASNEEISKTFSFYGIFGFKVSKINELLLKQFYECITNKDVVDSLKYTQHKTKLAGSIFSVLVNRYNIKKHNNRKYAEHLGIKLLYDQLLYIHRCQKLYMIRDYFKTVE